MVVSDRRKTQILSTAGNFFGVTVTDELFREGLPVLEKFLDSSTCRILCAHSTNSKSDDSEKNKLKLTNELTNTSNTLVFFKVAASPVTDDNFQDVVQVSSTGKNNSSTLIEALRQVWTPALQSSGIDPSLLKRLENDLLGPKFATSVAEEEMVWQKKYNETNKKDQKKLYGEAVAALKNIRAELESAAISKDGLASIEDGLEAISGCVDDLWKLKSSLYTEERMKCLLDIIGDEIVNLVETLINEIQVPDGRVKEESMAIGATACDKWVIISERLTGLFWPHHTLRPWKGSSFTPNKCAKFGNRLREIFKLRSQHRQLTKLLTPAERAALGSDVLLETFDELQGLCKDNSDIEWNRLKRKIEEGLTPAEDRVAGKLKAQFSGTKSPTELAAEFRRYSDLMKREGLRRTLREEREALLSVFNNLIELCQAEPDTKELLDNPQVLQEIQTAKVTELRLENLQKLGKELLFDLPGYEEIISKITVVLKETEKRRQQLVDSWIEDTRQAVANKDLSLGTNSAVVELTGTSIMKVNYDPRLTTLIREARAISGYGIELSREVRDLVERASSLAGRARALQQVANFHNTIGDRMVPSQRPLMLSTALELARAVREQSGVVWSDPHAVDVYTNRLRELVKKFARQNSELAAKHVTLTDYTANLLKSEAIDLATNQNCWKDTLRNMRAIVDTVETEYGNSRTWKLHWDRQLLKALGVAYKATLPSLLRKISEIRVELICRDGVLQWRPSLEEIRTKLYAGIRRFLAIPINFRGVGEQADGKFHTLMQRSAYLYGGVYKEAEVALEAIEGVRKKWMPLAVYVSTDIGEKLKGKSPHEWEKAFKDAKQWAQKIGKLRGGEVKIWCIVIDTGTTRNDLDSASRRYWERLSSDLRAEASSRLLAITEFLSSSSRELDRKPHTVEEMGLSYEAYSRIKKDSEGIAQELETVSGLSKILAAWTRDKLEGISDAHNTWQSLLDRLDKHQTVILRQIEDAKVNLRHRAIALRDERERWEAKWQAKPEIITLDWITLMRDRWESLNEQKDSLKADCSRLGLKVEGIMDEDENVSSKVEAELEAEELSCKFQNEFLEELKKHEDEEWSVARKRLPRLYDWLDSWESRIRLQSRPSTTNMSDVPDTKINNNSFVARQINEIRQSLEWIQLLKGDEIASEHWLELLPILQIKNVKHPRDITLGHLLKSSKIIEDNVKKIKEITKKAVAESGIRQTLSELEAWESATSLSVQQYQDSRNSLIMLVGEYGGLLAKTGELRLLLEGARGASGYERFAAKAARCETALFELEERLSLLSSLQRKWIYLEPVYGSDAAPQDDGRWKRTDKEFRYIMTEVVKDPTVPSLRRLPVSTLINLKDQLDRCQKSLDDFLEEKRSAYPRLYFLNDEDLLELVSGSIQGLESHLLKLYQGIATVEISNGQLVAVTSPEEENLKLLNPVNLNDPLPQWLSNLEEEIRKTLQHSLEKCLKDSTPDPSAYPAQILLLSERIRFTERCEAAIKEGPTALKKLVDFLEMQRARYNGLEDAGDKLTVLKARELLLDTVHNLKITRTILDTSSDREKISWTWRKQIRCYKTNKGAIIRCVEAEFKYSFEYQGVPNGLVQTCLTERCFLSLTQAMKLGLGGSPTGPAGTGKTESVKALGAILGRLVLVFNCDEGMDSGSMRRILGGLAQAGAWGCFDEFNRLEEETLSAVAMLIKPLQQAIRDNEATVRLGNQTLKLNPHCCIFITMNPASDSYGGRHKLPDSLARLFRPIGMAHPDKKDIVQTLLECAGFLETSTLANQLLETFDVAEKLLSKQTHYDWGLRTLKSVLSNTPSTSEMKEINEQARLLIGIKASTLPRLTDEDATKFLSLLGDIFSKTDHSIKSHSNKDLQLTLHKLCKAQHLQEKVVEQCLQLNDQLRNRCGVAVVGLPGSGKTMIQKLLADALAMNGSPVNQKLIYPGAISKTKLLGSIDAQTREWKEGLIPSAVLAAGESSTWIILDGDVEPGWAEALNSALDDNRLLTLPNGVGMKLGSGTRFIFETHELTSASPATISRLGIVNLGLTPPSSLLTTLRVNNLPPLAKQITNKHLSAIINQIVKHNQNEYSAYNLIDAALLHLNKAETQTLGTYCLLISLCTQIRNSHIRDQVAQFIYQCTDTRCPDKQKPFSMSYNTETDHLEMFNSNKTSTVFTENGPIFYSEAIQRGTLAIQPWIESGKSVLIRGSMSCGKKTLITNILTSIKRTESIFTIKTSSTYGVQDLISRLKRACVRFDSSSNGRTYRVKIGTQLILVLEDLHLASKTLQELLRELLTEGGFYEDDLEFAKIPVTAICTADVSTKIHPRLNAQLASYYMSNINLKEMEIITELHLKANLKSDDIMVKSWITKIIPAMVNAFKTISGSNNLFVVKDLILWANCLKHYSGYENELDLTFCLLDCGRHLFESRLKSQDEHRWESIITARIPVNTSLDDVFIWKDKNAGLVALNTEQWKSEIETAALRCAREGDPIEALISSQLLYIVTGLNWSLGTAQRGIVMVGRPGAGRRSAVKIVAHHLSYKLINAGPGRGKVAIKSAIQAAGIEREPTLLLLEEHHIRDEGLAILTDGIVYGGEIPGLLSSEEMDGLISPLVELARKEDFSGSAEQYFYHRIQKLLRVVVILDVNDTNQDWLSCSNLLRHCIIIGKARGKEWWFQENSLTELATQKMKYDTNDAARESSGIKEIVAAHLQAPVKQQAPARFLSLLHMWKELRESWTKDIKSKLSSLQAGISKLKEAGERVLKLEEEASKQRQQLEAEKARATAALEQITATMRGATGQRGEMTTLKAEIERESAELARRKIDIENELGKVEPLVEQAAQAVAGISTDALSEVRSLRAPPAPVRDVLEGVLRLMGIRDTSWNSMKTFLAKRGIKDEIRNWDARRSTAQSLEMVEKLVKEKPESFEEKTAKRASVAAAPLAAWVLANLKYGQVLQQVAPLEKEQRLLAQRLSAAEAEIGRLEHGLNTVESRVAHLQEELAEHSRGAAALQVRTEATETSLKTARTLLHKLDTEHLDWKRQFEELTKRKKMLDVEAATVASCLIYQDPTRDDKWKKTSIDLLITEREMLQWRAQGLPVDTASLVGAACALKSPLVPIFMDSSGIAVSWLKCNLGDQLERTDTEDSKFLTTVELAVRFGKPLLIEDVVYLPPILLPLLRRKPLRLGDRILSIQSGFKLFLSTRKDVLDGIPSEADAVIIKISLGSDILSLAERFIQKAILRETPELDSERREALKKEEELAGERDAARIELLERLGAANSRDLLQEAQESQQGGLLESLEATQSKAREIARALDESRTRLEQHEIRFRKHEKLAKFAAHLYKIVRAFSYISPLYVFSSEAFADIYLEAETYRSSFMSENEKEQEKLLARRLIFLTFHYCIKAFYRNHRLMLALHLAFSINPVPEIEKNLLLSIVNLNEEEPVYFNVPDYIPEDRQNAVRALATTIPQLTSKLNQSWIEDINNINADKSLTHFQRILAIQALRPDHLHTILSKWAADQLGVRDLTPAMWTLKSVAEEAISYPILLLLSPGADPGPELNALATGQNTSATGFVEISLGQGQIIQAETALESACKNGSWILLSNLQLALNWLPRLEIILRSPMCTTEKKPSTRIWLTTEECTGFYPGLAGLCFKLVYEPPEGVKRNVKRSLQELKQRQTHVQDSQKTLVLGWLHAILQERRRFVPQGWIKAYDWNEADLEAAYALIVEETGKSDENNKSDWEGGRGLLDVAVYGGRLQDYYDLRVLKAILRVIWCKEVFKGKRKLGEVLDVHNLPLTGDVLSVIDQLEDKNLPQEYFGLPANANRSWEKSAAESQLALLKEIVIKSSHHSARHNEKRISSIEMEAQQGLRNLIHQKIKDALAINSQSTKSEKPLEAFLQYERTKTTKLLEIIQMEVKEMQLSNIQTPIHWLNEWSEGPKEVTPFVNGLISRHKKLASLSLQLPANVDLSLFSRPRAFFAAFKQHTARELGIPINNLKFHVDWTNHNLMKLNKLYVVIKGLFITGAKMHNGILEEVTADAMPVSTVPECSIGFLPKEIESSTGGNVKCKDLDFNTDDEDYSSQLSLPVYSNSLRSSLIFALPVDYSQENRDTWIRRSVAFHIKNVE